MRIDNSEWLALSKEIKVKLIRLAVLENSFKFPSPFLTESSFFLRQHDTKTGL
ncbi:hypothetical protein ACQYAD_09105 [Neobacillus sp. SM06]|uniref:hypothetical protein n=1 Tax=Neobacillus sp. SM06 TaxID=3422492 RepID=UPI003D26DB17